MLANWCSASYVLFEHVWYVDRRVVGPEGVGEVL